MSLITTDMKKILTLFAAFFSMLVAGAQNALTADSPVGTIGTINGREAMVVDLGGEIGRVAVATMNEWATEDNPYGPTNTLYYVQTHYSPQNNWYLPSKAEMNALNELLVPNSQNTGLEYNVGENTLLLPGIQFLSDYYFGMYVIKDDDNTLLVFSFQEDNTVTKFFMEVDPSEASFCAIRPFHKLPDKPDRILYTSTDGNVVEPNMETDFGADILSNTYENGLGVITFDGPVTSIQQYAFQLCGNLESITIPSSVGSFDYGAFTGCSNLTSIVVDCDNGIYDSRDNCNAVIETATDKLVCGCKSSIIPNTVTSIGQYAFCGILELTSITIPGSVKSIGAFAFSGCERITAIDIPSSVTTIGDEAFANILELKEVCVHWTDTKNFPSVESDSFK